jgi:hypothetical protein
MDQAEAFSIFRRWRDALTTLRVDTELGVMAFSLECTLMRVEEPLVGFLLDDCGLIEFIFDETWAFDFTSSDAARAELKDRSADSPLANRRYEFGEAIIGRRTTGSLMLFLEIVREI